MATPFEVLPVPDGLPDFITDGAGDNSPPASPRVELALPQATVAAIEAHGWQYRSANETRAFFDRPGFWLRIYRWRDGEMTASVMPEFWQPGTSTFERYAAKDLAPDFSGRGAIAKANAFCERLIAVYEGWLADLDIELSEVAARLWTGWGRGGRVTNRTFSVAARCFL